MAISRLNAEAKAALREAGISQATWAREHCGGSKWYGDACGCPDDRCIGFHHGDLMECLCRRVLIDEYLRNGKAVAK